MPGGGRPHDPGSGTSGSGSVARSRRDAGAPRAGTNTARGSAASLRWTIPGFRQVRGACLRRLDQEWRRRRAGCASAAWSRRCGAALFAADAAPAGPRGEQGRGETCARGSGGQGQNRTADTAIFSRVLYLLSYLAMEACAGDGPAVRPRITPGAGGRVKPAGPSRRPRGRRAGAARAPAGRPGRRPGRTSPSCRPRRPHPAGPRRRAAGGCAGGSA